MRDQRRTTETTLGRLAARQHGVVTMQQALAAGLSRHQVKLRLAAGALVRAGQGVYRVAGAPRSWEQRALGACLAVGEGAVLCGRSAAAMWQLDLPAGRRIEVASRGRRGWTVNSDEIRVRRPRVLDRCDSTVVGRLPVTTVSRTLVDLAGQLEPALLQRVVDDALVRRLVSPAALAGAVARLGGRGRRGTPAIRRLLEPWLAGHRTESVAESSVLRIIEDARLPTPVCQHPVARARGAPALLDFAWPERMVALEVDGFRWHSSPRAHARDSARLNELAAQGWAVLRVTPAELASDAAAALAGVRRRLSGP